MSIYAFSFLLLSILCGALTAGADLSSAWDVVAKGGTALFGTAFVACLMVGKRIKFDPVLR